MTGENLKYACIALVNHKISAAHALILLLAEHGPVSMKEICDGASFSSSNGTGLVDSLCNQNLVFRHHPEEDRRKVIVTITPNGLTVLKSIKKQIEHV